MKDLISRQEAINEANAWLLKCLGVHKQNRSCGLIRRLEDLPSAQSEQTKMIKEIRKWINSENRGSADYFIVDKIEEIINKYEE